MYDKFKVHFTDSSGLYLIPTLCVFPSENGVFTFFKGHLTAGKTALSAGLAGGIGGVAGNPADIVLVRMVSDSVKRPEERVGYRNWCVADCQGTRVLIRFS
jgi:hypothetical protein